MNGRINGCDSCAYFDEQYREEARIEGHCHRYPPARDGEWPYIVYSNWHKNKNWCGEHAPRDSG